MLAFEARERNSERTLAYRRPQPRLREGLDLAPLVTAMMDVSDGLLLDSFRLAEASGVSLSLDRAKIPVAAPARLDDCIRWGDDYELLFTLPSGTHSPVAATRIGAVAERQSAPLYLDAAPLTSGDRLGYIHQASGPG